MSKFGWSYPAGCNGTPYDEDVICEVCGREPDAPVNPCECPECPGCGEVGSQDCYGRKGHMPDAKLPIRSIQELARLVEANRDEGTEDDIAKSISRRLFKATSCGISFYYSRPYGLEECPRCGGTGSVKHVPEAFDDSIENPIGEDGEPTTIPCSCEHGMIRVSCSDAPSICVSGYVEGWDGECPAHELRFPFTEEEFWAAVEAADQDGTEKWNETHGCPECYPETNCQKCNGQGYLELDRSEGYGGFFPCCPDCRGTGSNNPYDDSRRINPDCKGCGGGGQVI